MSSPVPTYLTVAEAAEVLRCTPFEVRRLCNNGKLKAAKPGKVWLITPDALRDFVEGSAA